MVRYCPSAKTNSTPLHTHHQCSCNCMASQKVALKWQKTYFGWYGACQVHFRWISCTNGLTVLWYHQCSEAEGDEGCRKGLGGNGSKALVGCKAKAETCCCCSQSGQELPQSSVSKGELLPAAAQILESLNCSACCYTVPSGPSIRAQVGLDSPLHIWCLGFPD